MALKLVKNAAGRLVPVDVNGRESVPFKGVGKHRPEGRKAAPRISSCVDYPADGDKRCGSLREALEKVGLVDGMVVSTHHHLRNGDAVGNMIFDAAADMGLKDLMWFPSASFPVHADQIGHLLVPRDDCFVGMVSRAGNGADRAEAAIDSRLACFKEGRDTRHGHRPSDHTSRDDNHRAENPEVVFLHDYQAVFQFIHGVLAPRAACLLLHVRQVFTLMKFLGVLIHSA